MTYFDFSTSKVTRLLLLVVILLGATTYFAYKNPNFTVGYVSDTSNNYWNRSQSALSYWWSYKLFAGDALQNINPVIAIASPAILAFRTIASEINQTNPDINGSIPAGAAQAASIPVILYHGESDASQTLALPSFIDQLRTLKQNGWQTINMEQFYSFIKSGKKLPEKSFLLTFDDGRKDSYYPTDPVLADLGYQAVMFVITGFSFPANGFKSTFYLSKSELQEMQNSGRWELQSHGKEDHVFYNVDASSTEGHFLSNKLWLPDQNRIETVPEFTERVSSDLENAKQTLEKDFGRPVIAYAYPFSDYGENSINFPESRALVDSFIPSIYDLTFYQSTPTDGDTFNYANADTYMMKRIEPGPSWTGQDLLDALDAGKAKQIPFEQNVFGNEWLATWGGLTKGKSLTLSATSKTTGAAAFLNGTGSWANYRASVTVKSHTGESIMLVARETNSRNYFFCAFSENHVTIRETLNGVTSTVDSKKYHVGSAQTLDLGIQVSGDSLGCLVDGKEVVANQAMSPAQRKGGIGIQVWDEKEGVAGAVISSLSVNRI